MVDFQDLLLDEVFEDLGFVVGDDVEDDLGL